MFLNIPPNPTLMKPLILFIIGRKSNVVIKKNENKEMMKLKENFKFLLEENEILKKS